MTEYVNGQPITLASESRSVGQMQMWIMKACSLGTPDFFSRSRGEAEPCQDHTDEDISRDIPAAPNPIEITRRGGSYDFGNRRFRRNQGLNAAFNRAQHVAKAEKGLAISNGAMTTTTVSAFASRKSCSIASIMPRSDPQDDSSMIG